MKRESLVKGFLIKPIMEILKKEYSIKSPTPNNLYVIENNNVWIVKYNHNRGSVDFTDNELVKQLLVEIKDNVFYDKLQFLIQTQNEGTPKGSFFVYKQLIVWWVQMFWKYKYYIILLYYITRLLLTLLKKSDKISKGRSKIFIYINIRSLTESA